MPKIPLPWSKSERDSEYDDEDDIPVSWSDRWGGAWARFHERLPWRRTDDEPEYNPGEPEEPEEPGKGPRWKLWAGIGLAVLLGVVGFFFLFGAKVNRRLEDRSLRQAREYLRVQDYQRAQLTLEQAVQVNPADLEARRELAQFYEEAGSPRALGAWHDLVAVNPTDDADRMALAHCALIFDDLANVTEALGGVSPAGRRGARYHQLMAAVALKKGDQAALAKEIAALATLEPGDARAQFNWAVVRRGSSDPAVRAEAQKQLEALAKGDAMRIQATLELIPIAVRQYSTTAYSKLAEAILRPMPGAFVTALGAPPRGLLDLVQHMESQPNPSADDAALLGEWLVRQGYPADAVLWLGTLKPELQSDRAVMAATAFALGRVHDWPGVEKQLRQGAWGKIPDDVVTLAFAARVQHTRAKADHADATWGDAVELAPSVDALRVLLRLSNEFNWPTQSIRVLRQIARVTPRDGANWRVLAATVAALRPASELLAVYSEWARAMPADPIPHGQVRWVQTLLGHGPAVNPAATEAAFPALSAARAVELDETGRAPAALAVLSAVPAGADGDWRVALARGLTLAQLGRRAESESALALAAAAPLIAEEKALLERARTLNSNGGPAR